MTDIDREADALALVAEAYEVAAITAKGDGEGQWFNPMRAIRAKTPADAIAAREARDADQWNDALTAAIKATSHLQISDEVTRAIEALRKDKTNE